VIQTLVSKLKTTYPTADLSWLIGEPESLDPVFAGRLAYLAKSKKVKLLLTEGYRSTTRQKELYAMYLKYLKTGEGTIKSAAKPGTSWHEYRLAIDTSTQPIRGMNNAELKPYGLCKPIAYEGWHIQPLETFGQKNRVAFAPEEEDDMTESEVRKLIAESQTVYKKVGDLPEWAKPTIEKLINNGHINPSQDGSINLTQDLTRALVILDRTVG
jgi:hypothetical protein